MVRSFHSHIKRVWKTPRKDKPAELQWQREQEWRNQGTIEHIERLTHLDRTHELGYRVKQGTIVVRVSVHKGGARKQRHKAGRRTKHRGANRIGHRRSIPRIAEERASHRHPDLCTLNSYGAGQDGSQKWQEVTLVDPGHPTIQNDDDLNQICGDIREGRTFHGFTNAGKKNRGLQNHGKDMEHDRPSIYAGDGRDK